MIVCIAFILLIVNAKVKLLLLFFIMIFSFDAFMYISSLVFCFILISLASDDNISFVECWRVVQFTITHICLQTLNAKTHFAWNELLKHSRLNKMKYNENHKQKHYQTEHVKWRGQTKKSNKWFSLVAWQRYERCKINVDLHLYAHILLVKSSGLCVYRWNPAQILLFVDVCKRIKSLSFSLFLHFIVEIVIYMYTYMLFLAFLVVVVLFIPSFSSSPSSVSVYYSFDFHSINTHFRLRYPFRW